MKRTIQIDENDDGSFLISEFTAESIYPQTLKKDALSCGRRLLQLLNIKDSVVPQDWPERIEITGTSEGSK